MKAAVWNDHGSLDVVDRPLPEPRPGWIRIRVSAVGICGTDLHFYRGSFPSPAGLLPGHEVGGVIDALGDGVKLPVGAAVAIEPQSFCGECYQCRTGNHNRCPKRILFGVTGRGGCAEWATVPDYAAYLLPDGVPPTAGPLVEPLAVVVRGLRRGRIESGQRVVILGAGTIGLLSLMGSRVAGAGEVLITARHPHQQHTAAALGADAVFDNVSALSDRLNGAPVDCVIETVGGRASTLTDAVNLVRPGGVVLMLGVFDGPSQIPALDFSTKEVTMVGSNCYGRSGSHSDFGIALQLLRKNLKELDSLVTHRFALEQVNQAFATAADKNSGSIKVHLIP
jgi:threonine dehydrogenase-like Zn-dependent dehydrogenase